METKTLLDIVYDALETEGDKQECIQELECKGNTILVTDDDGQLWKVQISKCRNN